MAGPYFYRVTFEATSPTVPDHEVEKMAIALDDFLERMKVIAESALKMTVDKAEAELIDVALPGETS